MEAKIAQSYKDFTPFIGVPIFFLLTNSMNHNSTSDKSKCMIISPVWL